MIHRLRVLLAAATLMPLAAALTGCGLGSNSSFSKTTAFNASKYAISGNLHGGQQAVTGSTVKLWAAGTTGYGAGATLVATTMTDLNGNFGFNTTPGISPCTLGTYNYITATGGNSGSGTNTQLAEMAAIPTACSATTGGQYVFVNEATTVAAVFALQQFMTINPGAATPWAIGAPTTNSVGLANAFATSGTLVSIVTGSSATTSTSNAVSATVGGVLYTTVINPDFAKINTLADILAACVNTAGGATCSSLFADTTPTGLNAPTDTIQAAYYLATNAAGLTMNAHSNAQGSPYYLCTTYVTATAPFQPTLPCTTSAYPYDWAIGVSFKTTNASAATVGTITAASVAIDGNGNIWTAADNSVATGGSITSFNVTGQVVVAPVTTATISTTAGWYGSSYTGTTTGFAFGGSRPYSLAIDTNNNAWVGAFYTAAQAVTGNTSVSGGTYEAPVIQVTPSGTATGYLVGESPGALTIDGSNNIFLSDITNFGPTATAGSSRYYVSELAAAGTPAYSTFNTGIGRGTGIYAQLTPDESTNQYVLPISGACNATILRTNNAIEANNGVNGSANTGVGTVTLSSTAPTTCVLLAATDAKNNVWGTTATYLEYIDLVNGPATAPVTTQIAAGSGTASTTGGLDSPSGVAIDGLGNVWVANTASSTSGGVSEFTPTTTTSGTTTVVAKSPSGASVYGFGSAYGYSKPIGVVIDPSGNVWIETTGGSYLNFIVGAAAPVVTPLATAAKNSAIGVRP